MGYDKKVWSRRLAERTDLSTQVFHLTREQEHGAAENLHMILRERCLRGSDPGKAFICGAKAAVCFQDAPLSALCQNVFYEQKYREQNPDAKLRYRACGVGFPKNYVYVKGGRPVLYEQTSVAKRILPSDEWWRIVNFDLSNESNFVDWTHEREWRCPGEFRFELPYATVLFVRSENYHSFRRIEAEAGTDFLSEVAGVVVMSNVLY
jgi:hypothetical protein